VNIRVVDQELAVESTDGVRLFHDRVSLPAPGFPFQEDEVMLPPQMVSELNRVFPQGEVAFAATPNLFYAKDPQGETLFASRRIGGKFPDVTKIVPEYENGHVAVPRKDLADAVDRVRSVVKGKPVRCTFEGDELLLEASGLGTSATEHVTLSKPVNPAIKIAFTADYLADALTLFGGDEVRLFIASPLRPVTIRDLGQRFFLLAPVKF